MRTLISFLLIGAGALMGAAASPDSVTVTGAPGPWGQLRSTSFRLAPPVPVVANRPMSDSGRWRFATPSWAELDAEFDRMPLTAAERAVFANPDFRSFDAESATRMLRVPDDIRLGLQPDARSHLYNLLAAHMGTSRFGIPFVLPPDPTIDKADLNPDLRARMRQLTFLRGNRRCIVDADLLMPVVRNPEERVRLLRLLYSVRALSVELARTSLDRRTEALDYWRNPAAKTIETALRRFEQNPGLASIDLTHLLPPLPQRLLNGFPDGANCPSVANCFWISLNFFATTPENRFLPDEKEDAAVVRNVLATLKTDYRRVAPPYRFGDIILYYAEDEGGVEPVHMAVHIADDIVFTKNGIGIFSPFILSHRADMEELYAWVGELKVQGYRKNE